MFSMTWTADQIIHLVTAAGALVAGIGVLLNRKSITATDKRATVSKHRADDAEDLAEERNHGP